MPNKSNRRSFLKTTVKASAAALAAPTFIPASALGKDGTTAPSNRITMGLIGAGNRGTGDMKSLLNFDDVQFLAVADVDQEHLAAGVSVVNKKYDNTNCKGYGDFRQLVDRKDIDAIVIGTPDHWHGLNALYAIQAGKDVYGEKPITHTFHEGQALYKAAQKHNTVWQTGSQQRSTFNFRWAVELIRNGHIGKVKRVEVGLPTGKPHPSIDIDDKAGGGKAKYLANQLTAQSPPAHLDYNMWVGPSKLLPYIPARVHRNWRWALNYGGGQLMDWIGHHNDIAHWGLDIDDSGPIRVEAKGFTYPTDTSIYDNFIDYTVECEYKGGVTSVIGNQVKSGCTWFGEDGSWIFVNRGKFEASNPEWTKTKFNRGPIKAYESNNHHRNFVDCIKSRKQTICPAETSHRSITPGHLGLISQAVGRPLKWNPKTEKIIGDKEASKLLNPPMRKPWKLS